MPGDLDLPEPGLPGLSVWVVLTFSCLFNPWRGRKGKGGGSSHPFLQNSRDLKPAPATQPENRGGRVSCILYSFLPDTWPKPSFHLKLSISHSFSLFFFSFSFHKLKMPGYFQRDISSTKTLPGKKAASINIGILFSFRQWLLKLPIFTNFNILCLTWSTFSPCWDKKVFQLVLTEHETFLFGHGAVTIFFFFNNLVYHT